MKFCYTKTWGDKPEEISSGIEFGRKDTEDKLDWERSARWKWLDTLVSFTIQVGKFEALFRFYHPDEWRGWILKLR